MTLIFEQSSTSQPLSVDLQRLSHHWRKNWVLARRTEGPVIAFICAAFSTAETLRRY